MKRWQKVTPQKAKPKSIGRRTVFYIIALWRCLMWFIFISIHGGVMLTITEAGKKGLEALLAGKNTNALRIYLASAKCTDPRLGIEVKEAYPTDKIIEENGFSISVDPVLFIRARGITIDQPGEKVEVTSAVKYALTSCARCGGCRKKEGYS